MQPRRVRERRNSHIVALLATGMSAAEVGRLVGLTRERVRQVYRRATGLPVPRQPRAEPIDVESRRVRRFWSRVRVDANGCWMWTASCYPSGYGSSGTGYAHRVAYEYVKGPIPHGLQIDHLCRVKACVNPDHLEAVTVKENVRRGLNGVLRPERTHCRNGHPTSDPRCRTCIRDNNRRAYAKRRAA